MQDTLDRERQINNIIDRLFSTEERLRRLEELMLQPGALAYTVPEPATGGRWSLEVIDEGGDIGPVLVMVEL